MVYNTKKLGTYLLGNTRKIKVKIKNTGNVRHTFYVGAFIAKNYTGSGCNAYPTGSGGKDWFEFYPPRSVTLDPGQESDWIVFNFKEDYLTGGTWYACVKVWEAQGTESYTSYFINSDTGEYEGQKTVKSLQNCLDGECTSFSVTERIVAEITRIEVE